MKRISSTILKRALKNPKPMNVHIEDAKLLPVDGELYPDGINYTDVDQGQLGNCYLASTASAIAYLDPKYLESIIRPSTKKPKGDIKYFDVDLFDIYEGKTPSEWAGSSSYSYLKVPYRVEHLDKIAIQKEGTEDEVDWDIAYANLVLLDDRGYLLGVISELKNTGSNIVSVPNPMGIIELQNAVYSLDWDNGDLYVKHLPTKISLSEDSRLDIEELGYSWGIEYLVQKQDYKNKQFNIPAKKVTVTVSNEFWHIDGRPLYGFDNQGDGGSKDLWWPVLEKAVATFLTRDNKYLLNNPMGYESIGNGGFLHHAQALLLNINSENYIAPRMSTGEVQRVMDYAFSKGLIINFGTNFDADVITEALQEADRLDLDDVVVTSHAYEVQKVEGDSVICRNPWGNNGVYGGAGYGADDTDGVFKMSIELLKKVSYSISISALSNSNQDTETKYEVEIPSQRPSLLAMIVGGIIAVGVAIFAFASSLFK